MEATSTQATPALDYVPLHAWTYDIGKVLLVKCVDRGGKSHDGFQWPKSGRACCPRCETEEGRAKAAETSNDPCTTGGLFGWPWGLNLGGGKEPDYSADWIVFAADPAHVIDLGDKSKVAGPCEVLYYGQWLGAMLATVTGREAWIAQRCAAADGKHATGYQSAASATGYRSASSATGDRSASSATGDRSAALLTGPYGTIELGEKSAGVCTAEEFTWVVHLGAVLLCRWSDGHALLTTEGLEEGARVRVVKGKVVK